MIELKNRPVFRLCNDSVFKEIFTKVPNALASLISEIMNIDYFILHNNIEIERSELEKNGIMNKSTTCDFVVKVDSGFKIDVEINTRKTIGLNERNFLFVSRLYSNMIPRGTKYKDLSNYKVAQININGFGSYSDKVLTKVMLMDLDTNIPTIESIIIYNFDIAKCFNMYYNKEKSNIDDKLVRWGMLLWTEDISNIANIIGDDLMSKEDKEKFIEVAEELNVRYKNFTKEQLEQHEEFKLAAERESGKEEGLEQGFELGIEHAVKKMLAENLDIELISKITELTKEEIMKIKESN